MNKPSKETRGVTFLWGDYVKAGMKGTFEQYVLKHGDSYEKKDNEAGTGKSKF